jgi:hypothetical protein
VVRESSCSNKNLVSIATLGVVCRPLCCGVTLAHRESLVRLRWMFFLSSLFFFSRSLENHAWTLKKILCPPICNLIDYGPLSFNYCFFGFWTFLNFEFFFNFILGYFIQFSLLFLFSYSESELVTLTWVGLRFFRHFFLLNSCFLLAHPFDIFFNSNSISRVVSSSSYPDLTWIFFFSVIYITLSYWVLNFTISFCFSFWGFFRSHISGRIFS